MIGYTSINLSFWHGVKYVVCVIFTRSVQFMWREWSSYSHLVTTTRFYAILYSRSLWKNIYFHALSVVHFQITLWSSWWRVYVLFNYYWLKIVHYLSILTNQIILENWVQTKGKWVKVKLWHDENQSRCRCRCRGWRNKQFATFCYWHIIIIRSTAENYFALQCGSCPMRFMKMLQ